MTRSSPIQVAFSAGEVDPLLHRRFDYQRFQTGLAKCHGFFPLPQGGFTRAPGTTHCGIPRDAANWVLVPFQFSAIDAVLLEFSPGFMRVWRYGVPVLKPDLSGPYEIATPFGVDDLPNLRWVQSADRVYLVDGVHPMQRLSRFALNLWTIADQTFNTGPFRVQNLDEAKTMSASATSGTITLTSNFDIFTVSHVGSLMQLSPADNSTINLWTSNEALTVGATRRYGRNVYEFTAGTNAGTNPPIHSDGEDRYDNAPTKWLFLNDEVGIVRITAITDARTATAVVLRGLSAAVLTQPSYRWSEGAWSAVYGFPSSIEIADQRLCLASTISEPRTVWFSGVGDYADHLLSTEPDGAFSYVIAGSTSQNQISGLRRGRTGLHIFALSEEYSSRSDSRAQVIGPTTAVFSLDGSTGAQAGQAIAPEGDPMFISRDGRRLMLVRYSIQDDGNRGLNLSRASQHIGNVGLKKVVWTQTPQPRAWMLRNDGSLACMIFDQAEEILGWSTHSVGGDVIDIAVSQNADGTEDEVYLVVKRGTPLAPFFRYSVERFDYSHHLFNAIVLTIPTPDPAVAEVTMPWLSYEPVTVWQAPPEDQPSWQQMEYQKTVSADGSLALLTGTRSLIIGSVDPSHQAQTLDIQAAAPDGNSSGRLRRLHAPLGIGIYETRGGTVQVIEDHAPNQEVASRAPINLLARAAGTDVARPHTGVISVDAPSGNAMGVSLLFRPVGNAPMTITGITPTIQEAGR